jgi:uncharacterized protein (TIRG00374 family)
MDRRRILLSIVGIAFGAAALVLAFRGVSWAEIASLASQADLKFLVLATLIYAISILLRAARWGVLVNEIKPVRYLWMAEATTAGFAANYVLPARLGELFRIGYLWRLAGVGRTLALATVAIERVLDGVTVVALILLGLGLDYLAGADLGAARANILWIAMAAGLLFVGLASFVAIAPYFAPRLDRFNWAPAKAVGRILQGLRTLNQQNFLVITGLTAAVWCMELMVLWSVLAAFQVKLSLANMFLTLGCATLSTLVPTAPGFVGSYQLVFGLLLSSFGSSHAVGFATATAIQVFCYLPVTVIGVAILAHRSIGLVSGANAQST